MAGEGLRELQNLRAEGQSPEQLRAFVEETTAMLQEAEFSTQAINDYWGIKDYNPASVRKAIEQNLAAPQDGEVKPITNSLEALEAGFQMSTAGLAIRQDKPELAIAENTGMFHQLIAEAGSFAGDLPAMLVGGPAGAVVGGALTGGPVGAAIGLGAGAFALPQFLRKVMMDHYRDGSVDNFRELWARISGTLLETTKGGILGAATAGAGLGATKALSKVASPTLKQLGIIGAEAGTLVSVGAALEQEYPDLKDFVKAGLFIGGLRGTTAAFRGSARYVRERAEAREAKKYEKKMMEIFEETGVTPDQVIMDTLREPGLKEQMLEPGIPEFYRNRFPVQDLMTGVRQPRTADPKLLTETSKALAKTEPGIYEVEPLSPEAAAIPERRGAAPQREVSAAESAILERIGEPTKEGAKLSWGEIYRRFINENHPWEQMIRELNPEGKLVEGLDPQKLLQMYKGTSGKADQFLEGRPFKASTLEDIPGLRGIREIFESHLKEGTFESFKAYGVSKRARELEGRGIETGMPKEAVEQVLRDHKGNKKFEKDFKDWVNYHNSLIDYMVDRQLIAPEAGKTILEANLSFLPFKRVIDPQTHSGAGSGLRVRNPVKAIKGSERKIIDPVDSGINNTYIQITLAERNHILNTFVEFAKGTKYLEKVSKKVKPIELLDKEVRKVLEEHGFDAPEQMNPFTIFRAFQKKLAPDEFLVFEEGKPQIYRTLPEIAEILNGLDQQTMGWLTKVLRVPASGLRAGATLVPDFMVRNLIRDQFSAFVQSKSGFIPVVDTLRGLGALLFPQSPTSGRLVRGLTKVLRVESDLYQKFLKSGAANSSLISIDRVYLRENIYSLNSKTGFLTRVRNLPKSFVQTLRIASELAENATRLGEFQRALSKGATIREAGFRAREITIDFQRHGANVQAWNMITAFWNAHVQGIDRYARAVKETPTATLTKTLIGISLPSAILWWVNKDNKRVQALPDWQRDLFWIIDTGKTMWRIPKPFEPGLIFGTGVERILQGLFTEDPDAFENFGETIYRGFVPEFIPTGLVPIAEQWANRSRFRDAPLIPRNLEDRFAEYQYKEYTSETAKAVGRLLGMMPVIGETNFTSPVIIENYINAWSGNTGRYTLELLDKAAIAGGFFDDPKRAREDWTRLPFVRSLTVRYPTPGLKPIQKFEDDFDNLVRRPIATARGLGKERNIENLGKVMKEHPKLFFRGPDGRFFIRPDGTPVPSRAARFLVKAQKAMSNHRRMLRRIHWSNYSPDEKAQLSDNIVINMRDLAMEMNKLLRELEK